MLKGKEKETGENHKFTKGGKTSEKETVEVQSHPKAVRCRCEPYVRQPLRTRTDRTDQPETTEQPDG